MVCACITAPAAALVGHRIILLRVDVLRAARHRGGLVLQGQRHTATLDQEDSPEPSPQIGVLREGETGLLEARFSNPSAHTHLRHTLLQVYVYYNIMLSCHIQYSSSVFGYLLLWKEGRVLSSVSEKLLLLFFRGVWSFSQVHRKMFYLNPGL